jgi:glycosyltransferase involved in cell wall biosynthesis
MSKKGKVGPREAGIGKNGKRTVATEKIANIFVSAVLVADEYAEDVAGKTRRLADTLKARYANYEVIVTDNGIGRKELDELKAILTTVPCIRIIRLSRNHDTDTAIFAGVEAAIGDYICLLYNTDPLDMVPEFIGKNQKRDIVFGVARNLIRRSYPERLGARVFYWYSKRYLGITLPHNSTYFISMNRGVANALTRSGRFIRHIRHMTRRVGFTSTTLEYELPDSAQPYSHTPSGTLVSRAIDLTSSYSSHPLRVLSYLGLLAGGLNIIYALYVVVINLSRVDVEKGWTTLSLQSSIMFFILFMILAALAEYIGKILIETQQESPYHIMQELSSTISIADETRLNVTK